MNSGSLEEGVTKFDLAYTHAAPVPTRLLRSLVAWRAILWRLGLIGQDPNRYGGAGFGNVSRRLPARFAPGATAFAVTGTQTGTLPAPDARHFAIVTSCEPGRNRIEARGPIAPSSESLTHGMLYALVPAIRFIFHVHSPEIWRARAALALAATDADVAYGTPAMAREMERLAADGTLARRRILAMAGHEDGVIAFGRTADHAGAVLLRTLAAALSRLPG